MKTPESDKQNQQKCKHCGRIVGCDYHGRKHKCNCSRGDDTPTYERKIKECLGKCPYCNSDNLDFGVSEILDDTLRYPATCLDCGESFDEDYAIEYAETGYLVKKQ